MHKIVKAPYGDIYYSTDKINNTFKKDYEWVLLPKEYYPEVYADYNALHNKKILYTNEKIKGTQLHKLISITI